MSVQIATAQQVYEWGANVLAIMPGTKKPAHPWKRYQTIRQTRAEVDALPWGAADRIGIINGVSGIRSFDIDGTASYEPVHALLAALGLPEQYRWVEQSGGGNGWHVWVVCEGDLPAGVLSEREPGVYFADASVGKDFDHLELRWRASQTIIASSGGVSRWLNGPPDAMPARVGVGAVLDAFLSSTKRPEPTPEPTRPDNHSNTDIRERIRSAFDLVAFAELRFGGPAQRDPDGQVRVLGNGGLLLDVKRGVWYRFNGAVGGDCFDLVGLAIYGDAWQRGNKEMFRAAFAEAAAFTGTPTEARRVHRERGAEQEEVESDDAPMPRYRLWTARELKARPPPTFQVEDLIPARSLGALVGAPGSFKTFVALDLALCVATGTTWQGKDVARGRIVFVSAEDADGLALRIRAWETKHYVEVEDDWFRVVDDAPQLLDGADVADLIASIQAQMADPDGIVIDTVARTFNGEENSSQDMGTYIRELDRIRKTFKAFILVVHHLNALGTRARGSSAFLAALDVEITATGKGEGVTLDITKAKNFSKGLPLQLSTEVVMLGKHLSSLVLGGSVKVSTPSADERHILALLVEVFGGEGVTQTKWEKVAMEGGMSDKRFAQARRSLVDRGLVNAPPYGTYVRGFRYCATAEGVKVSEGVAKVSNTFHSEGVKVSLHSSSDTLTPSEEVGEAERDEEEENEQHHPF